MTTKRRRKAAVIGFSALVAAAAIAIPIGIVFGTKDASTGDDFETKDLTESADVQAYEVFWNGTVSNLAIPPVPSGYSPGDYASSKIQGTNFVSTVDLPGTSGRWVEFLYTAAEGSGKKNLLVKYPLRIKKVVSLPLNLPVVEKDQPYGNGLESIDFIQWLAANGYPGYVKNANAKPDLTDDNGAPVLASAISGFSVGTSFRATYTATLDAQRYETTVADNGKYVVRYTVVPKALADVQDKVETTHLNVGDTFVFPPSKTPEANFVLKSATPLAKVTVHPAGSTNTPAVGDNVVENEVSAYDDGTEFTVQYDYTPAANYSGNDYKYTITYTVGTQPATQPTQADRTLPPADFQYGKYSGTAAPAAPSLGTGYTGSFKEAKIKTQSSVGGANSPAALTDVDWSKVNTYNAGTQFEVVYDYAVQPGYSGTSFTASKAYTINKQQVTVGTDVNNTGDSFKSGADVTALSAPAAADAKAYVLKSTEYFQVVNGVNTSRTAAEINALVKDDVFTIEWTYELNGDNYEPASGTTRSTYKIVSSYTVSADGANYTGKLTYDDVEQKFGTSVTNFTPTDLPEPSKGTGYVYKGITYSVTKSPASGTPAVGVIADLSKANTYAAGTEITATVTFEHDTNYTGNDIQLTKVLKIVSADGHQPTAAEMNVSPVVKTYGDTQAQPSLPKTFTGFTGAYDGVTVKTPATTGVPTATTVVNWSNFNTYGAGTVLTVKFKYTPDGNYSGLTEFTISVDYSIGKLATTPPTDKTLPAKDYAYGSEQASPATVPTLGTGYTGTLKSAKISKVVNGSGLALTADVVWADTDTYPAGTEFTLTYSYAVDANHTGNPFDGTQTYTVKKQLVPIPTNATGTTEKTYEYNTAASTITKPTIADTRFEVRGGMKLLTISGADMTETELRALKAAAADGSRPADKFKVEWTVGLKDLANYAPSVGTADSYKLTETFVVSAQVASYTGVSTYSLQTSTYKSAAPTNFIPTALPEPAKSTGYSYLSATYAITKASTDGKTSTGTIANLTMVNTYGAGTEITATFTFVPSANYTGSNQTPTKILRITQAAGTQPSATDRTIPQVTKTYGDTQAQPDVPKTYTGFTGAYTGVVVQTPAKAGQPTATTTPSWSDFATYGEDTVLRATYTYTPDTTNYSGLTTFTVTVDYKILPKAATKPTSTILPVGSFEYHKTATQPSAPTGQGVGYAGTYTKAVIKTPGTGSPGTGVAVDWTRVSTYDVATVITVTFTYSAAPNYTGPAFTMTKDYSIVTQKIDTPVNIFVSTPNTTGYSIGDDPSTIAAPDADASGFWSLSAADIAYFSDTTASATSKTAAQIEALAEGDTFAVRWKYVITDPTHYAPKGTNNDYYYAYQTYQVGQGQASYTGKKTYDDKSRVYKAGLLDTIPTELPEPSLAKGYKLKSETYRITRKSNDNSTKVGPIADLSKSADFGAATIIAATYVFEPAAGYTGQEVTVTGTLLVVKKPVTAPTAAELAGANMDVDYKTVKTKPTTTKTFEGYFAPTYIRATVTTAGARNNPAVNTIVPENWSTFHTYNAGTVVTVTFNILSDVNNYTGITGSATYTETYTISKKTSVEPTQAEKDAVKLVEKEYLTTVAQPSAPILPGEGYTGVYTSAVVSAQKSTIMDANSPAVGVTPAWASFKNYNAGTEIEVTYTYTLDSDNYTGTAASYTYVQTYKINQKATVKPTLTYPTTASYTWNDAGRGGVAFAKPTLKASNGKYYDGALTATITTKGTIDDANSPAVGTDVNWNLVNKYNAGTQFTIKFTYKVPNANYAGDDVVYEEVVTVNKWTDADKSLGWAPKVTDNLNTYYPGEYYVYYQGTSAPTVAASTSRFYYFDHPSRTYLGSLFTTVVTGYERENGTPLTEAELKASAAGTYRFVVRWTYNVNTDNVTFSNGVASGTLAATFYIR